MVFIEIRKLCGKIAFHPKFELFIIAVILFNAVTIGLETSAKLSAVYGWLFDLVNLTALIIFIIEAALKITSVSPQIGKYFKDPWNQFDFSIIVLALIPATGGFATVARLARLLRILRLVTKLRGLRVIVTTLLKSIPGIGNVLLLLGIIFYIFGVLGFQIFHESDPANWGTLGTSLLSLFRIATLDSWSELMYIALESNPYAWIFFTIFVLIGGLTFINLFIGVILLNIGEAQKESLKEVERPPTKEELIAGLKETKEAITNLQAKLDKADFK